MSDSIIVTSYSLWWLIPALLISIGVTYVMYSRKEPWDSAVSKILGGIRVLATMIIVFLLLQPLINSYSNREEKPVMVVAVDNSESVKADIDSAQIRQFVDQISSEASDLGFEPKIYDLDGQAKEDLLFDKSFTDLDGLLNRVQSDFQDRNLAGVVLVSDGIYNRGKSPIFHSIIQPVYTLGLGDTSARNDIAITRAQTNKVAYQGNKFPVEVFISSNAYLGKQKKVVISQGGKMVASETIGLQKQQRVSFELPTEEAGIRSYTVTIEPESDEENTENNKMSFTIEVVEGKERILIVGASPHPDIRAIRASLNQSDNYETAVYVPSNDPPIPNEEFDVVILHQAFSPGFPQINFKGNPAKWYIGSQSSDLRELTSVSGIQISTNGQRDKVGSAYNAAFGRFELKKTSKEIFNNYPSLDVPFGEYNVSGPTSVLINQQIGSLVTDRPLFTFYNDGETKSATLLGTGIWKWRLQENVLTDKTETFDDLVLKTIQYLSISNDRRKFIFEPQQRSFTTGEVVSFISESYDDVYERMGGNSIDLVLRDENGNERTLQFVGNTFNSSFNAGMLPAGIYQYVATSRFNGREERATGDFSVSQIQLESLSLTADHNLLRDISDRSNGQFYNISQVDDLLDQLSEISANSIIHTDRTFVAAIDIKWLLLVIVGLFAIEWFMRKYLGSY